jgi:hypothetical protein
METQTTEEQNINETRQIIFFAVLMGPGLLLFIFLVKLIMLIIAGAR